VLCVGRGRLGLWKVDGFQFVAACRLGADGRTRQEGRRGEEAGRELVLGALDCRTLVWRAGLLHEEPGYQRMVTL